MSVCRAKLILLARGIGGADVTATLSVRPMRFLFALAALCLVAGGAAAQTSSLFLDAAAAMDARGGSQPLPEGFYLDPVATGLDTPVAAAFTPDGRVLVLGRDLRFPFRFFSLITVIDPQAIRPAALVRAEPVAAIRGGALSDNYEGIAAASGADGQLTVWLVSDDNQQQILQSTKLLELVVDPADL